MSAIFSTGPMLQRYIVALITSDETSIYGSSFQKELATLPKLNDWFEGALAWPYLLMGLIVVIFAVRSASIKQTFIRLTFFGFLALLLFDITYSAAFGELTIPYVFENTISNFVGALGASTVAVAILTVADYGFKAFSWPIGVRRSIAASLVLLNSTLAICALFYFTDFFYRPRPANITLIADSPTSGFIFVKNGKKRSRHLMPDDDQKIPAFSLISQARESSNLSWTSHKLKKMDWSSNDKSGLYDIEVSFFKQCLPSLSKELPPADNSLKLDNVSHFSLWHDGESYKTTIASPDGSGSARILDPKGGTFWIKNGADNKKIDLEEFVADNTDVLYSGGNNPIDIFMVMRPEKLQPESQELPKLHFDIDGKEQVISVLGSQMKPEDGHKLLECLAIPTRQAFEQKAFDFGTYSLPFGVRILISPKRPTFSNTELRNIVTIKGDAGWVSVEDLEPKALERVSAQRIDAIEISENLKTATVNGVETNPKPGDTYFAIGKNLRGSFVSGLFKVSGDAELVWVNSNRANQTKWETLSEGYKAAVITLVISALGIFVKYNSKIINKDDKFAWLEDCSMPEA